MKCLIAVKNHAQLNSRVFYNISLVTHNSCLRNDWVLCNLLSKKCTMHSKTYDMSWGFYFPVLSRKQEALYFKINCLFIFHQNAQQIHIKFSELCYITLLVCGIWHKCKRDSIPIHSSLLRIRTEQYLNNRGSNFSLSKGATI